MLEHKAELNVLENKTIYLDDADCCSLSSAEPHIALWLTSHSLPLWPAFSFLYGTKNAWNIIFFKYSYLSPCFWMFLSEHAYLYSSA